MVNPTDSPGVVRTVLMSCVAWFNQNMVPAVGAPMVLNTTKVIEGLESSFECLQPNFDAAHVPNPTAPSEDERKKPAEDCSILTGEETCRVLNGD